MSSKNLNRVQETEVKKNLIDFFLVLNQLIFLIKALAVEVESLHFQHSFDKAPARHDP